MKTVRTEIIEAVRQAIGEIEGVGVVVDAAAALPGAEDPAIGAAVAGGEYAVELVVFDDVPADDPPIGAEAWTFDLAAIVHLPDALPEGREPYDLASEIHHLIYQTYRAGDPSWGGKALDTLCLGGGGVALGPRGTRETASMMQIRYRHRVGDMEVAV